MRIVGVNGIACHGEHNIDLLLRELAHRGLEVRDVRLPRRHFVSARWGGCSDGAKVARESRDGDILVAHSFGSLRAWHAHQVRRYRAIVCIAPAMSAHVDWLQPKRVHCYHSSGDWAVRFGAKLLLHPFGSAGVDGFSQFGVHNHRETSNHNGYFRGALLTKIADLVECLAK